MQASSDLVTVYRSMDGTAKEDCEIIVDLLTAEGLSPVFLDDEAPGVPEGTYEIRVPAGNAARAEQIIAENPPPNEMEDVDTSEDLDLETIFSSEGSPTAEFEAMSIKNVLEANGIAAVIVGDSVLPNLPFEVQVAHDQVERARAILEQATKSGPADAAEAELESEK